MSDNGHQKEPVEGNSICPDCGSEKRLIGDFVSELKKSGDISKDAFPDQCGVWELPFMELEKLGLIQVPQAVRTFPKVRVLFDVCGECKRLLILRVEFGEGTIIQQSVNSQQVRGTM